MCMFLFHLCMYHMHCSTWLFPLNSISWKEPVADDKDLSHSLIQLQDFSTMWIYSSLFS